jgi:hypothetical protein
MHNQLSLRFTLGLALSIPALCAGQTQTAFPDPYGEPINKTISWWKNQGQEIDTDGNPRSDIHFVSEGTQPKAYLREKSSVSLAYAVCDSDSVNASRVARIDVTAVGGANEVDPVGSHLKDHVKHYWLEHTMPDPVLNVPGYGWVRYEQIYEGITWHWYGGSAGTKMAFVCQPGSDPARILLRFEGQDSLSLDWQGALKIYLEDKWLMFEQARAYQYDQQGNLTFMNWAANYELVNGLPHVKFNFDSYDPMKPLVFFVGHEPVAMGGGPNNNIPYSTYLGTSMKDEVNEIAVAANGDYYAVGDIEDHNFPAEVGLVPFPAGWHTGIIAKFDKDYVKQWAGYYSKRLRSIALDEVNNRIIVGSHPGTGGLFTQQYGNGYVSNLGACAVAMFSNDPLTGSPGLLWSTHWKGTYLNKVQVDSDGRIYIAGSVYGSAMDVQQPPGTFPFYQPTNHGQLDGYVACFDANTNLVYSTFYGGEDNDHVLDMALHEGSNRLAIVGRTESIGNAGPGCQVFSGQLPQCYGGNAFYEACHNSNCQNGGTLADGLIAWFSLDLDWVWSTRFGGPTEDYITAAHFTPDGSFYIAGYIGSQVNPCPTYCAPPAPTNQGFPICGIDPNVVMYGGNNEHFLAKFAPDRSLMYSRFVGGGGYEFSQTDGTIDSYPMHGPVLEVDVDGYVYLAGSTTSGGSAHPGAIVGQDNNQYYFMATSNGLSEAPPADRSDVYIMKLDPESHDQIYGSYYGGRFGVPLNHPGWSLNQDVITCITVRDQRLFIGGSTASTFFFPVNAIDGVAASFQQLTPPVNQAIGAADLTHAFIAQLSWVYDPVGIAELGVVTGAGLVAWFSGELLTIQLPETWSGAASMVDLFDADGRLIVSQRAVSAAGRLLVTVPGIAAGIYIGRLRDTAHTFKVAQP